MTMRETTLTPSHAAIREQLRAMARYPGQSVRVPIVQARMIARVIAFHADLGEEWGEKFENLCEQAMDVLAKLEEEDDV